MTQFRRPDGGTLAIAAIGLLVAVLSLAIWGFTPHGGLAMLYGWMLLAFAVKDIRERRVPNRWLIVAAPIVVALSLLTDFISPLSMLAGGLFGLTIGLAIAGRWPQALGMGDAKLAGLLGLMAGFPGILFALPLGMIAGGLAALVLLLSGRARAGQTFAYAPYLVMSAWLILIIPAA
ncbi:MAG: prepilin peptidase [Caldilineales bacterium]|nr:prepilin peptidase [Caldilineales bacterium]